MPCNLAVTITKAVVAPEHLLKLLTPQVVEALVSGFIQQHAAFQKYAPLRVTEYGLSVAGGQKTTFGFSFVVSAADLPCSRAGKSA